MKLLNVKLVIHSPQLERRILIEQGRTCSKFYAKYLTEQFHRHASSPRQAFNLIFNSNGENFFPRRVPDPLRWLITRISGDVYW